MSLILQNVKSKLSVFLNHNNIIYIAVVSVFLHYYITLAAIILLALYIIVAKENRKLIFVHKGAYFLLIFSVFATILAAVFQNWPGVICSVLFAFMFIIGLFARSTLTRSTFERALNIACLSSVFITVLAIIEKLLNLNVPKGHIYRTVTVFFNANYMATAIGTVIIICAYKVITKQGNQYLYYGIAAFDLISLYLTGSLFVWVEIFIGVAALLFMFHRHQLLSIFLLVAATGCIVLYIAPQNLPRLRDSQPTTQSRVMIWDLTIEEIKDSPLVGKGFLTYFYISSDRPGAHQTQHAHSLYLDPLLNFGIIGTALLLVYFFYYYRRIVECINMLNRGRISTLILALTVANLVHGIVDVTMLWIQTGLLFIVIMGGIGVEERKLINK